MKCLIRGGEAFFAFKLVLHSHLYGLFFSVFTIKISFKKYC